MRAISTFFFFLMISCSFAQTADTSLANRLQRKVGCGIVQPVKKETTTNPVVIRTHCNRTLELGNEPLFVIDGIPFVDRKLPNLKAEDIDSIWVLKNATATAIYGSQGANGVIIITTKGTKLRTFIIKDLLVIKSSEVSNVKQKTESFTVFPNPVSKGGILNIKFKPTDSQKKILRVLSVHGRLLSTNPVKTDKALNGFQIQTDALWAAGIYFVQLLYENGKVIASDKIILQ